MTIHKLVTSLLLCGMISLFSIEDAAAQVEFELKPSQSMCITGKGPGQDAANNPFEGEDCLVLVKNIGTLRFAVRTQQKGQNNLKTQNVDPDTTKTILLPKGHELYLDTNNQGMAKASLSFRKREG